MSDAREDALTPEALANLHDALHTEQRLLGDLGAVLHRQRDAVAANDVDAVDDSTFATHRVLLTLGEARRRRRRLMQLLQLSDSLPLGDLASALGDRLTPGLRRVCDDLQQLAAEIAREVAINRMLLRGAISSGESLVRALSGTTADDAVEAHPGATRAPGGAILNRTI